MRILVTGGSGFIGSNLVDYLINNGHEVFNLSRHTYAMNPRVLEHLNDNQRYHFCPIDLRDGVSLHKFFNDNGFDVVYHLAASTHVDRSFLYPREFLENNVVGTFNLLETIRHLREMPKLIHMSTDEVFGDVPPPRMCREDDEITPRNPYSASKASAEAYCSAFFHSFNLPVIIARSMNNYGPRQHPEKLIAKIITRSIKGEPFTLYKGGSVRGWVYVEDTCSALDFLYGHGKLGEIYHIPGESYLTVSEVAANILSIVGKEGLLTGFKGTRLKDDERYALSGEKLKMLGWEPEVRFSEGLRRTIDWFVRNEWFWQGVHSP